MKKKFVRARTAAGRKRQIAAIRRNYAKQRNEKQGLQRVKSDKKEKKKQSEIQKGSRQIEKNVLNSQNCDQKENDFVKNEKVNFPSDFPFWARLKIAKHRTTLVIDEERSVNTKTGREEDMYVHREATHTCKKDYEEISPNPDSNDPDPMYLKRPSKLPQRMFEPHNKKLDMPEHLKQRYVKNNQK